LADTHGSYCCHHTGKEWPNTHAHAYEDTHTQKTKPEKELGKKKKENKKGARERKGAKLKRKGGKKEKREKKQKRGG